MLGYNIKEMFMGSNKHTLLEDYTEDISMLSEMAEDVEFTIIREAIIREAIKYGKLELKNNLVSEGIYLNMDYM